MDPRFRRRRVEVLRQEGRRRLRVLIGVTSVVSLAAGGSWMVTDSPFLDLDRVVVEGAVNTTATEVRFASGLRMGQALFDVDKAAAARAVETLPWVLAAGIERRWPGEVRIRIAEREAVAVAPADAGAMALVDGTGRVLEWVEVAPPGLPVLAGLVPAGPAGSTLPSDGVATLAVAVAMPAELRARTSGVAPAAGGRGEVEMSLNPEGMVKLGPPEDLDRKFTAIRAVLAQVDLQNLAVLDVRRPDSPVLTRREPPVKVSTPRAG